MILPTNGSSVLVGLALKGLKVMYQLVINPFRTNDPILYLLTTPVHRGFSGVFGDIKWEHWLKMDSEV